MPANKVFKLILKLMQLHFSKCQIPFLDKQPSIASSQMHSLMQHINIVHKKIKQFYCMQCKFAGPTKGYLRSHVQLAHYQTRKSFMCKTTLGAINMILPHP